MKKVLVNGWLVPAGDAKVGVTDMGFNYGAGVYEVVKVYEGVPYRLTEHLERFNRSAAEVGLPVQSTTLAANCSRLVQENKERNAVIYLQATFGDYGARSHTFPAEIRPTIIAFTQPAPFYPEESFSRGITLKSVPDLRWGRCDIKSTSLIANLLAVNEAQRAGFDEAVFVDAADGTVAECAASNIFAVKDGVLITPPKGTRVLSGITRETILRLAGARAEMRQEYFSLDVLKSADEVFISSTTKEIMPVRLIDSAPIAAPGRTTAQLINDLISDVEAATGVRHPKRAFLSAS